MGIIHTLQGKPVMKRPPFWKGFWELIRDIRWSYRTKKNLEHNFKVLGLNVVVMPDWEGSFDFIHYGDNEVVMDIVNKYFGRDNKVSWEELE